MMTLVAVGASLDSRVRYMISYCLDLKSHIHSLGQYQIDSLCICLEIIVHIAD